MPTTGASYELTRRIIEVLSADQALQDLLFPTWAPLKLNQQDTRIYAAHAALKEPSLLTILPRIIVECVQLALGFEQADIFTDGSPVDVFLHVMSPQDQYNQVELLDQRIRTIVSSTNFTNTRIIASEMVQAGPRRRIVDTAFYDAWRLVTPYEVRNVGVLV